MATCPKKDKLVVRVTKLGKHVVALARMKKDYVNRIHELDPKIVANVTSDCYEIYKTRPMTEIYDTWVSPYDGKTYNAQDYPTYAIQVAQISLASAPEVERDIHAYKYGDYAVSDEESSGADELYPRWKYYDEPEHHEHSVNATTHACGSSCPHDRHAHCDGTSDERSTASADEEQPYSMHATYIGEEADEQSEVSGDEENCREYMMAPIMCDSWLGFDALDHSSAQYQELLKRAPHINSIPAGSSLRNCTMIDTGAMKGVESKIHNFCTRLTESLTTLVGFNKAQTRSRGKGSVQRLLLTLCGAIIPLVTHDVEYVPEAGQSITSWGELKAMNWQMFSVNAGMEITVTPEGCAPIKLPKTPGTYLMSPCHKIIRLFEFQMKDRLVFLAEVNPSNLAEADALMQRHLKDLECTGPSDLPSTRPENQAVVATYHQELAAVADRRSESWRVARSCDAPYIWRLNCAATTTPPWPPSPRRSRTKRSLARTEPCGSRARHRRRPCCSPTPSRTRCIAPQRRPHL